MAKTKFKLRLLLGPIVSSHENLLGNPLALLGLLHGHPLPFVDFTFHSLERPMGLQKVLQFLPLAADVEGQIGRAHV